MSRGDIVWLVVRQDPVLSIASITVFARKPDADKYSATIPNSKVQMKEVY